MITRRIRIFAALALAAAPLGLSCRSDPAAGTPGAGSAAGDDAAPARQVRVVVAAQGTMPRVVTVTGTLAAEEEVALGMKVAGRLAEISVDLGSHAIRGQPLARLASTDFGLRIQQAEAAVQQARARLGLSPDDDGARIDPERTSLVRQAAALLGEARMRLERARKLSQEELMSRADLDAAEAAFQVAEGRYQDALEEIHNRRAVLSQRLTELELARQQLKDSVLYAPFDGAVRERQASEGQFVAAGQPIVTLVRVDPLRLRLSVPERDAAGVREGQTVRLTLEGDTRAYKGRVVRISPAIEEANRTLRVEAEVPNPTATLRPGSFATAEVVTAAAEPVLLVPASAIVNFAGIEKVILVKDGRTVERRVQTGRRSGDQIEILEGVEAGEQVVVEPGNLVGGQTVAIVT